MTRDRSILATALLCLALAGSTPAADSVRVEAVVEQYCSTCHDHEEPEGGLD